MKRNYDDPEYTAWRAAVRKRDGYKCQMPGCNSTKKLKCHHIMPWSKYPYLRYDTSNGVVLCRTCHDRIRKYEHLYANMFLNIIKNNNAK